MKHEEILQEIKKFSSDDLDFTELEDATIFTAKNFVECFHHDQDSIPPEFLLETVKYLKIMCTKGSSFQNLIVNTTGVLDLLKDIVTGRYKSLPMDFDLKCFQLIANLCVKNEKSLDKVWNSMSVTILQKFMTKDSRYANVAAMITYNMLLSDPGKVDQPQTVAGCLHHLAESSDQLPDFVQIILDHLICESQHAVEVYDSLTETQQKTFLFYINDHIENENNKILSKSFLQHLTLEFKKKSDCILKTVTTQVDAIDPDLIVALLDVISSATPQEKYLEILKDDRALFLNLGCLLQSLHKVGKNSESVFAPMQKLDALVKNSDTSSDFEKEISYSLKTKLVISLANLSHKNKRNQELAREMEIMQSIFECTNADARNPLITEWSILAIRNLCEDNPENQEIVRNLTKVADAPNPVLKEMGLESGMVRIAKK